MMQSFNVGLACEDDICSVHAIECECFSHPWTKEQLMDELKWPYARLLVARAGGGTAGYLDEHIVCGDAHINNVAVSLSARRKGIASALIKEAVRLAKAAGCDAVTLEVRGSNTAAKALYRSLGFSAAGVRRNFYRDPAEDGETMILILGEDRC